MSLWAGAAYHVEVVPYPKPAVRPPAAVEQLAEGLVADGRGREGHQSVTRHTQTRHVHDVRLRVREVPKWRPE